jgi:DNA polymerase III delta prime subunit
MRTLADHLHSLDHLHHAYGISPHTVCDEVLEQLEELSGRSLQGVVDVWIKDVDQLTIDDAREIKEKTQQRPITLTRTFIIVAATSLTAEAQHALLKVLEEPTGHSHIFLCVPDVQQLLPTVRSRLYQIALAPAPAKKQKLNPATFVASSSADRIASLKSLLEKKDHQQTMTFLHGVEATLGAAQAYDALKTLYMVKDYVRDRGSSQKVLLEHLATTLPVVQSKHV